MINELTDAINRVSQIVDDANEVKNAVLKVWMHKEQPEVLLTFKSFLDHFDARFYDIERSVSSFYYELNNEVDGVLYRAHFDKEMLSWYKESHPEHFAYIEPAIDEMGR